MIWKKRCWGNYFSTLLLAAIFFLRTNLLFARPGFLEDFKHVFTSPLRMGKKDILPLSIFTLTATSLIFCDEKIRDFSQGRKSDSLLNFFSYIKWFGDGRLTLPIFSLFYLNGLIFKSKKAKETGRLGIEAFLFAGLISQTGKSIFGRARPYCNEGAKKFYGPDFTHNSRHSLPSGHATVVFSFASVIAHQYPEIWVGFTVYSIAGTVGISRIYENKHWASDVFVGAVIGTCVGRALVKFNEDSTQRKKKVTVLPTVHPSGIKFVYRF